MTALQHCPSCGTTLKDDNQFCQKCGAKVKGKAPLNHEYAADISKKSGTQALILCIFFGILGFHRFYVRRFFTGLLNLITGGFLGIWTIVDLIRINNNKFTDKKGNYLIVSKNLTPFHKIALIIGSIIFWLVIIISLILTIASYLTSGIVATADAQLEALRKGNIEQAYSYTSQQYQQAISLENFKQWLNEYPELKNNKSTVFDQRGVTNSPINNAAGYLNSGFLEGTITTTDNKQLEIKYIFLKEKDTWKIVGIFPERPK